MKDDEAQPLGHAVIGSLFSLGGETPEQRIARDLEHRLSCNIVDAERELSERMRLRGKSPQAVVRYCESMMAHHQRVIEIVESPIEQLVLPWLITMRVDRINIDLIRTARPTDDEFARPRDLRIIPQLAIGRYRLDFALVLQLPEKSITIAVECDGREFHRLPDDAVRDRYLAALGIPTVRISGSEINKDPRMVVPRTIEMIDAWLLGKLRLSR